MKILLTEKHSIKKNKKTKELFKRIDAYCFDSKNLRNATNYVIKQCSRISYKLKNGEILESWEKAYIRNVNLAIKKYNETHKVKTKLKYIDNNNGFISNAFFLSWYLKGSKEYKEMPMATCSQICIQGLCSNWKGFYESMKTFKLDPSSMLGRPKPPDYLDKENGRNNFTLTSQQFTVDDAGNISFPNFLNGLSVKTNQRNVHQVRINVKGNKIKVDVVYEALPKEKVKGTNVMGVDLGVNNLASVVSDCKMEPFIINGRPLKSINHNYNKQLAYLQSNAVKYNGVYQTKAIMALTERRNNKVLDYMHKASKLLLQKAIENNVTTIVIGNNKGWKQEVSMGDVNNQNFVQIPHATFINLVTYKAEQLGIHVNVVEESFTSGTSYIDGEEPTREYYNNKRRIKRGLFKSSNGIIINADINAAYQILKKAGIVVPYKGVERVVRLNAS